MATSITSSIVGKNGLSDFTLHIWFYECDEIMSKKSRNKQVAKALAALGHEARLDVYPLLFRAGHSGLLVGEIAERLDMPASTLSHHLGTLVDAKLVVKERRGREVINRLDFDTMSTTMSFLTNECCVEDQFNTVIP